MTAPVYWLCSEGHSGAGSKVPEECPGVINRKPCLALCWRTNASGFPLHPPKDMDDEGKQASWCEAHEVWVDRHPSHYHWTCAMRGLVVTMIRPA